MILRAGESEIHVIPETGGAVAAWTWRGLPVMRSASNEDLASGNPRRLGAYPLIPYSGRIAGGHFTWKGEEIRLPLNFPPETVSIHGNAWQSAWTIAEHTADRALLTLDHAGDESWPFPYRAGLGFHLLPDGLDVAMHICAAAEMPAGLGWHPYFHRGPGAALGFHAERVWIANAENIPEREVPPEGNYAFYPDRVLDDAVVDNCYSGWDRQARPQPPGIFVQMDADPVFTHLIAYTPAHHPYFCVEPASHAPNAINRPEGMPVLAPGDVLEGGIRLRLAASP